jgi:DNA-binding MarR family transcriptional regulator
MKYKNSDIKRKGNAVPRPGEGKRGPEGHLGYLVRQANSAVRAAMEKVLADLEVTPPQFAVLTMIANLPRPSGADLARLTFLTPPSTSSSATQKAGAIENRHTSHGRILQLTATAKGQALPKRCRTRVMEVEDRIGGLVSKDEERVVRRWLSAVAETLADAESSGPRASRPAVPMTGSSSAPDRPPRRRCAARRGAG